MIVALTGFMGCGKSSVASLVASKAGCFYFDLDDTIQMEEGLSIPEIFEEKGEEGFRNLEYEYLSRIFSDYADFPVDMVIALGGGTVLKKECARILKENAKTVYLRASVNELVENLKLTGVNERPLLRGSTDLPSEVSRLLSQREAVYESAADTIIDTDGVPPEALAQEIIEKYFV